MEEVLVNRVANSGLLTLNLEEYFPTESIVAFDIKDYLYMGLMLREKDFRAALAEHDWHAYEGKILAVHCSADAIVPYWAFMLVGIQAAPFAAKVLQCTPEQVVERLYDLVINDLNPEEYRDKRIVIKGCSQKPVPVSAYLSLAHRLAPVAKSIMYGEPCSTVPLYKKKVAG
jgi:Protein of unknown function (DUF2480)